MHSVANLFCSCLVVSFGRSGLLALILNIFLLCRTSTMSNYRLFYFDSTCANTNAPKHKNRWAESIFIKHRQAASPSIMVKIVLTDLICCVLHPLSAIYKGIITLPRQNFN